ncbi:Hypothetical predicted protein, partial [Pelobates cultripes]
MPERERAASRANSGGEQRRSRAEPSPPESWPMGATRRARQFLRTASPNIHSHATATVPAHEKDHPNVQYMHTCNPSLLAHKTTGSRMLAEATRIALDSKKGSRASGGLRTNEQPGNSRPGNGATRT